MSAPPSTDALVDLGGNVFEWTADVAEKSNTWFMTCGGSWKFPNVRDCSGSNPGSARNADLGFRCAADPR